MLGDIEVRAAELPAGARAQVEQVQASVAEGMDELMTQARRTADEAQAIDAAFQDRVRRNFEMLTEAVRLMGTVAVAPPKPLEPQATDAPDPVADEPPAPPPKPRAKEAKRPPAEQEIRPSKATRTAPADRPRLRLTPTATDEEFSSVFEAAAGRSPAPPEADDEGGEAWTWKDLLASLDGADADGERLEDLLGAELSHMGVDADSLLPKGRVEQIAATVHAGDIDGARQVVRRLAPAATRRIGRRLFTDDGVKRQVEIYVRRYQTLVDDTIVRDPKGQLLAELLNAPGGKLYLLLDASAGDLI